MGADQVRFALLLLAAGAALLWSALRRFKAVRRIQDTARSKAASAPQGNVELEGIAWPDGETALVTPSGAEVVYYSLDLEREEKRGAGKTRRTVWISVFRQDHTPSFFLIDATGLVRVEPRGAEVDLDFGRATRNWRSLPQAQRERILEIAAGQGIAGFPPSEFLFGLFSPRFRIVESQIRVGSPLYAQGDFRTTQQQQERVRVAGLTQFHARFFDPARREPKRAGDILDENKDGKVSAKEEVEVLCQAAASARQAPRNAVCEESEFFVYGGLATSSQHKLFIADRHEQYLVQGMGWTVYAPFAAGVAALSAGLVLLSGNFRGTPSPEAAARAVSPPGVSSTLRSGCLRGEAAACSELLRRAAELRIPDGDRGDYARRACALGLHQYCLGSRTP